MSNDSTAQCLRPMDPLVFRLNSWVDLTKSAPAEQQFFSWFDRSLLVFLGNACNMECVYCFKPTEVGARETLDAIDTQIARGVAYGCHRAILTGGEPLVHPELDQVIARLPAHGIKFFGIQTNGLRLADSRRVDSLVAAGMRFCHLSVDSPDAATQNKLARHPRTFQNVMKALRNLARHPEVTVHVKAVVTTLNAPQLVQLVTLFLELERECGLRVVLTLTPMVPPGAEYNEFQVLYPEVAPELRAAIDVGRQAGLLVYYHHIPYCLMDGRYGESIDWFLRDELLQSDGNAVADSMYTKADRCAACALTATCQGFPRGYADLYGDEAFVPIGASPSRRPAAKRILAQGSSSPAARLVITTARDGVRHPFPLRNVIHRLPQLLEFSSGRVILTGAEPLLHPALPQIIALLAERGLEVWLETLAHDLTSETLADLLDHGLAGVRWLHLPETAEVYGRLPGADALAADFVARTGTVLANAGVPVEHVFLPGDESTEALQKRVLDLKAQPFQLSHPGRCVWSDIALGEKWSGWLGLGARRSREVAPALSRLLESESRMAFRGVVPGPE